MSTEPGSAPHDEETKAAGQHPDGTAKPEGSDGLESVEEWKQRCLRTAADLQNLQRRLFKEKELIRQTTVRELLRSFLPCFDNLDRAVQAGGGTDAETLLTGVRMVMSEILRVLGEHDVRIVEPAAGAALDPNIHEAVTRVPHAEHPEGTIVHLIERGYLIGDVMIRPARVVIAAKPSPE